MLVGNDAHFIARGSQPQHGPHEIGTKRAEDPGGAQDHGLGPAGQHRSLARQLARAVDPGGARRVVLAVGCGLFAGEDVVGGDMHQRQSKAGGGARHYARAGGIDRQGQLGLALRPVNRGVGCGVADCGGTGCSERTAGDFFIRRGEIERRAPHGHDLVAQCRAAFCQCPCQLPGTAGHRQPHFGPVCTSPSRSPS